MTDDFEARWRAVAAADPMHATYPEAVPGYRRPAGRAIPRREAGNIERCPCGHPDLWHQHGRCAGDLLSCRCVAAFPAVEPITSTDRDTGGMIAHWPKPDGPPAPVIVTKPPAAITDPWFDSETELREALAAAAPKLATPDAVQALRDAIARAETRPARRWWDPRGWWRP